MATRGKRTGSGSGVSGAEPPMLMTAKPAACLAPKALPPGAQERPSLERVLWRLMAGDGERNRNER